MQSQILSDQSATTAAETASAGAHPQGRLVSLDALRGFNMLWITGFERVVLALAAALGWPFLKGLPDQFEHGPWVPPDSGRWAAGFHFYDIIMPLFLFCAGTSMPFSFAKRLAAGESKSRIYRHIAIRCTLLFILGMIHQGYLLTFDPNKIHIYCNTLQAIACGYAIAALLYLNMNARRQALVVGGLILLYWVLLAIVPFPGQKPGPMAPDNNLAIWLDKAILGRFQDRTYYTWILSSMVFGCTVGLGSLAGQWLRTPHAPIRKFYGLAGAGAGLLAAGFAWSGVSPIVKYIWSSSFVLFSGGICLLMLAGFYLVVDVWGWRRWTFPLVVVGANAIVAYMADQFLRFREIASRVVGGLEQYLGKNWFPVLQYGVAFGILWLMLLYMYKKKTFVRV